MIVGLTARLLNKKWAERKGPKPSLLRQAIMEQLPLDALGKPKILLEPTVLTLLAIPAIKYAKDADGMLVVCFIRQVNLSYKYESESKLTLETDLAALKAFSRFLDLGHEWA